MKRYFFIFINLLLLIGCSPVLKWDDLIFDNFREIFRKDNIILPSLPTPPCIRVNNKGDIYILYSENNNAINKLYLTYKKDNEQNWNTSFITENNIKEVDLIMDKDGEPNIFYQKQFTTIYFYWWKDGKIIKEFNTGHTQTDLNKIKCLMDKNDNMCVFYIYSSGSTDIIEKLDFSKDLTSDIVRPSGHLYNVVYDVIIDKERDKFHLVYNYNITDYNYKIYYINSDDFNSEKTIRSLPDFLFSNFSISLDKDDIVIGYSFYPTIAVPDPKYIVEKIKFSKSSTNIFFEKGDIITEFPNNISKSFVLSRNGIIFSFSTLSDIYDRVFYTKNKKEYYEKDIPLLNTDPATSNLIDFFVDNKGYSYILYVNNNPPLTNDLRLLTNRPF